MSKFTPQFLDELRSRTTLSSLIGQATKLQRAGREWRACCPFHSEKTPSFYVNDDKGFYHCFGCSAHGDAIRWLTDQRGLAFVDAVKELADAAGLALPAPDPKADKRAEERATRAASLHDVMAAASAWFIEQLDRDAGADARSYVKTRGLSAATAQAFGIGFAPDRRDGLKAALTRFGDDMLVEAGLLIKVEDKAPYDRFRGRLMIPIRDPRGRVIAFGGRILGDGEPKYLNSPETPLFDKGRTLYNLDRAAPAARKAERLIVVEGYLDVIALAQAGIDEVVAPLGTALTEAQLERLWRVVDVPVLCFDGDGAGRKAAVRAAERALPVLDAAYPDRSLRIALLPTGQDPDDVIKSEGVAAFQEYLEKAEALDVFIWNTALNAAQLDTPEQRSAFGKSLRDVAKQIRDDDLRLFYLAAFNRRLDDLFDDYLNGRNSTGHRTFRALHRRAPSELVAIGKHGIEEVTLAPSAIAGLLRFPALIIRHAEAIAQFTVALQYRDYRQLVDEMLGAALEIHPLDRGTLRTILGEAGLAPNLHRLFKRKLLPYSFLDERDERPEAETELGQLLERLAALPELKAAMEAAAVRAQSAQATEYDFEDLKRLVLENAKLVNELKRSHVDVDYEEVG